MGRWRGERCWAGGVLEQVGRRRVGARDVGGVFGGGCGVGAARGAAGSPRKGSRLAYCIGLVVNIA